MHFQIYKDAANQWRWRLRAGNNEIVADGSESYVSKRNVLRALRKVIDGINSTADFPVIERLN